MSAVARLYRFRAQHSLSGVPGYEEPHWHEYTVEVIVKGDVSDGMVVDTQQLDDIFEPWLEELEGSDLNEVVTPSTVENLAEYFKVKAGDVVTVWEDDDRWGRV